MNRFLPLLLLAGTAAFAQAPGEDPSVAAERARLKQAREKAEAAYRAEEKSCYGKFAVNDCLDAAKARRREAVADLRRQEIALNDAERKRKAAERRRQLDEKAEQQREREAAAPARAASQAQRTPRPPPPDGSAKAAERAREVQQRTAEQAADKQRREAEAAAKVKAHEQRQQEAKKRAERVNKRLAERTKPPASSLKDPS